MVVTSDSVDAPARDDEPPPADPRQLARPWYDQVEYWVGVAVVAACCIYVFTQLQPSLLFRNTTTSGGDTGAHVWFPAYLRDHLLPWRLAGWAPDFYAGLPAGQFYFPLPALLIVALDVFIPYNIAFKLGTALGPIMLPVAAYSFGRGIRAPRPAPAFFAIGVTGFMFWTGSGDSNMLFDLHIMGGNLASTLAGEYSFMIAVGFALFFLGAFARALDGRRNLWLPAVLLAATMTSHLVVAIFAVLGAAILWLARRPHRTVLRAAIVLAVGGLLTALWSLPLATTLGYTTDMRYDPVQVSNNYFHWLFPPRSGGFELFGMGALWYLYPLAIAAIVGGIVHRRRVTLEVAGLTAVAGFVFYQWEGIRHTLGKAPAWNLRLLPFWFVMLYLLAALGAAELARWA